MCERQCVRSKLETDRERIRQVGKEREGVNFFDRNPASFATFSIGSIFNPPKPLSTI